MRSLFQNEGKHGGLATVEAVELIADFVKTGECLLHPDVVEVCDFVTSDTVICSSPRML